MTKKTAQIEQLEKESTEKAATIESLEFDVADKADKIATLRDFRKMMIYESSVFADGFLYIGTKWDGNAVRMNTQ